MTTREREREEHPRGAAQGGVWCVVCGGWWVVGGSVWWCVVVCVGGCGGERGMPHGVRGGYGTGECG